MSSIRMERAPRSSSCYYNPSSTTTPSSSSFSSTLLDTIYRSFDESHNLSASSSSPSRQQQQRKERKKQEPDPDEDFIRELAKSNYKSSYNSSTSLMKKSNSASCQVRGWGWIDTTHNNSTSSSTMEYDINGARSQKRRTNGRRFSLESAESISSEDMEPLYYHRTQAAGAEAESKKKNNNILLKPIRTCSVSVETGQKPPIRRPVAEPPRGTKNNRFPEQQQPQQRPPKSSAKSRAMKLYGDLKRMKQPISPGGRLASFLNSLFSSAVASGGGAKKQRISTTSSAAAGYVDSSGGGRWESSSLNPKSPAFTATTPSSSTTSSLSRSCLSSSSSSTSTKSTSTSTASEKRSVRFNDNPVSVVIDEDMREGSLIRVMEKNRSVEEEAARDLLKNYQEGVMKEIMMKRQEDQEDDDDDDDASCCSADLFELKNLLEIGRHYHHQQQQQHRTSSSTSEVAVAVAVAVDRYREELPVYETTHVGTNRAIASGLIV